MVLVLPSLFGLTLIGEGLNKVMQSEKSRVVLYHFGVIFIAVVMVAYVMISGGQIKFEICSVFPRKRNLFK